MELHLTALIERLCQLADDEGCWSIRSEEVAELLGIKPVPFWRAVAGLKDRISLSEAIDGWTQDSVGDLVTLLERLAVDGAEKEMTRAGLFLPYTLGIELAEELMFHARTRGAAHVVRLEELAGMLRHTANVRAAVGIYLDEHTDLEALLDAAVESFQALHGLPPLSRSTARRSLQRMLERHVLDRKALMAGLEERLRLAAAQLGYMDPEDRSAAGDQEEEPGQTRGSARRAWARRVMGVDRKSCTTESLRLTYRKLMMRYHPDVDPSGLERCKDINAAYSILISDSTRSGTGTSS
ncbi:MAG: J domain-containing protein [Spirochaetia bacterium]